MIVLKEIDRHNFDAVTDLEVFDEQKSFVAPNAYSLAEAKVKTEMVPLAVYEEGGELVGFVMYCIDESDKEYWVYRLMTDKKYQGRGYGRAVMEKVIERIKADEDHHVLYISFEPENVLAERLYRKLGFVPDGREVGGETVYRLDYQ